VLAEDWQQRASELEQRLDTASCRPRRVIGNPYVRVNRQKHFFEETSPGVDEMQPEDAHHARRQTG
jgi:hypothetical protein